MNLSKGVPYLLAAAFTVANVGALAASNSNKVGEIDLGAIGNKLEVTALTDPKVEGVTCHLVSFDRSTADRFLGMFGKQNPFEDPSNSSIACRMTGPIKVSNIPTDNKGEDIFNEKISAIFKSMNVKRIYDCKNDTLIYVSYAKKLIDGSAKQSVSTVPLYGASAQWSQKPACQ